MFRSLSTQLSYVCKRYAGHSKWANIKHIKEAKDAERSAIFAKLSRQIKVAVTLGGSTDPKKNSKLNQVIDQCKRFNMPTATLQNVLRSCESDKNNTQSYMIDIKGPGNCFILCELYTHQLHQLRMTIATQLKKHRSKFGDGAGNHLFEEKGIIAAENPQLSSKSKDEQLELATEHAIESNAEEVILGDDNIFQFLCSSETFPQTQTMLEKLGYKIVDASVDYVPLKLQEISPSDYESYEKLLKKLNEMPEVVRLFDNVNIS
ncbi:translational activator of cytochrome c oxidase 1 [Anthonomus grandis grandis]|uniref:translational activator of cytochrome c oxidase 1 n=1 Tax=Anthonomus grandis grandis TaxID=2921223 RepID=UPI002164F820|nr:translational activator of cytochrome c oxidase 1 [Anthonomus grandis grandis]